MTKDVAPYSIVGGIPAKLIRMRFDADLIEKMLTVKWWRFDAKDLSGLKFSDPNRALDQLVKRERAGARPRPFEYRLLDLSSQ